MLDGLQLQLIGGHILHADKSYKVVKYIYTATNIEGQSQGRESLRASHPRVICVKVNRAQAGYAPAGPDAPVF